MKKLAKAVLLITMLISACNPTNESTLPSNISKTPEALYVSTVSPVPTAGTEFVDSTAENLVSISEKCLNISSDSSFLPKNSSGQIVIEQDRFSATLYQKLETPYLYNLNTGEQLGIPGGSGFSVSLDQESLAYVTNDNKVAIMDKAGEGIIKRTFQDISLLGWAKDGLFVLGKNGQAFWDPTTNERQELPKSLPNMYLPGNEWDPYWFPYISFDPTLTKAVYTVHDSVNSETYIALWDVNGQKEISSVSRGSGLSIAPGTRPEWSSDGEQVILATFGDDPNTGEVDRKLVAVQKDGTIITLMQLPIDLHPMYFSLSPDQTKLAFWSPDPSNHFEIRNLSLYIFDITANKLVNYCIVSPFISVKPIWSPNNTNLAVELLLDLENSEVIIVDIETNIAVKIAEDARPVGWLK